MWILDNVQHDEQIQYGLLLVDFFLISQCFKCGQLGHIWSCVRHRQHLYFLRSSLVMESVQPTSVSGSHTGVAAGAGTEEEELEDTALAFPDGEG